MTFDTQTRPPIPPKGLLGRFINVGEVIEATDLQSYVPWSEHNANWKSSRLAAGLVLKASCIAVFFRSISPYECDKQGYYIPPKPRVTSADYRVTDSLAPAGLMGRFLKKDEVIKENDLINYNSWASDPKYLLPPKWRRVIGTRYKVMSENSYFRAYQKYLLDENGIYLKPSDDKTFILDAGPAEPLKVVKKISQKGILHNIY